MNPEETKAAAESRADAGLTQNTDRAIAYETGFEAGLAFARANPSAEVLALVDTLEELADYNSGNSNVDYMAFVAQDALSAWRKRSGG